MPWTAKQVSLDDRHVWSGRLLGIASFCGLFALITLVWEIGWPVDKSVLQVIRGITWGMVIVAALAEIGLMLLVNKRQHLLRGLLLLVMPLFAFMQMCMGDTLWPILDVVFPKKSVPYIAMGVVQLTLILPLVVRTIRKMRDQSWFNRLPPGLIGLLSFALAILLGTCLLMTPNATEGGIKWIDALFTSTSAVCVTGLSTLNVETQFTFTGQAIILVLIQIGGLGVMTLTYFLALIAGQGINLRDRVALRDLLSEDNLGQVGNFIWHIVGATLLIELAGILLLHHFWQDTHMRSSQLWWDCVFHGISAFCNAGFSTYGDGLMHASVKDNHAVHSVIMVLIVLGGFGFALFTELSRYITAQIRRKWTGEMRALPRLSVHCRLATVTTFFLLLFGMIGFAISGNGWWEALFNSVSCRTAGFNITNFGGHGAAALVVACVLMAVGGNPGGTAGGIKTTTFAIILLEAKRLLLGRRDLVMWDRRASRDAVERSFVTLILCVMWISVASVCVGIGNPLAAAGDVIFEVISAFGTVGLTRGLTSQLSDFSKVVIIVTMFAGRIGILTFAMTLSGTHKPSNVRLPEARVPLG